VHAGKIAKVSWQGKARVGRRAVATADAAAFERRSHRARGGSVNRRSTRPVAAWRRCARMEPQSLSEARHADWDDAVLDGCVVSPLEHADAPPARGSAGRVTKVGAVAA